MDLLNLPPWNVLQVQEEARCYSMTAEASGCASACPWCSTLLLPYRFGTREFTFTDLPMHGKQVQVKALRQRFRCRACRHTWLSGLPGVDEHHAVTERLIQYVERETLSLSSRTFVSLARELGLAESSVRNLFDACVKKREQKRMLRAPRILGIDELHLLGAPRCILTDIAEKKVIPHNGESTDGNRQSVDMWAQYRTCARELLPDARIVVDPFHVLKMASSCLETVRKTLRASLSDAQARQLMHDRFLLLRRPSDLDASDCLILEAWLGGVPILRHAYERKEEFYAIYEAANQEEAHRRYVAWLKHLTPDIFQAFVPLMTAVENWGNEIFNYWTTDEVVTNAFTEAKNGAIRVCHRAGRGYGLPVIRAKVIFAEEIAQDYGVKLPCLETLSTVRSQP